MHYLRNNFWLVFNLNKIPTMANFCADFPNSLVRYPHSFQKVLVWIKNNMVTIFHYGILKICVLSALKKTLQSGSSLQSCFILLQVTLLFYCFSEHFTLCSTDRSRNRILYQRRVQYFNNSHFLPAGSQIWPNSTQSSFWSILVSRLAAAKFVFSGDYSQLCSENDWTYVLCRQHQLKQRIEPSWWRQKSA